ncbi:MAG: EutP/PduV family microcompartment system protein [Actinomycetia bacterium]|nr:EutP/PduV family microcompartment system protein [Actinomycetes bacterium]
MREQGWQLVKKVMLIGASGSGKTTLSQRLFDLPLNYLKTQSLEFNGAVVDTPGEYLENRNYYAALQVTSMEVDYVALVMGCRDTQTVFPPGITRMFTRPTLGIITKADLMSDERSSSYAEFSLRLAGVQRLLMTSAYDSRGIDELKKLLEL